MWTSNWALAFVAGGTEDWQTQRTRKRGESRRSIVIAGPLMKVTEPSTRPGYIG